MTLKQKNVPQSNIPSALSFPAIADSEFGHQEAHTGQRMLVTQPRGGGLGRPGGLVGTSVIATFLRLSARRLARHR